MKINIITYGCSANVNNSEIIEGILLKEGHEIVDERESTEEEASAETEETTTEADPVAESMSAEDVEKIISAKLESFTAIIEGLGEMTKSIADNNATLVNELSSLRSEFEAFKAQPSVEAREGERFSKVGNLTTRQQFLLKNKK